MPEITSLPGWGTNDELVFLVKSVGGKITDATITACTIPLLQVISEWDCADWSVTEVTYFGMN